MNQYRTIGDLHNIGKHICSHFHWQFFSRKVFFETSKD